MLRFIHDRIADWNSEVWKDVVAYSKSLPDYPKTNDLMDDLVRVREKQVAKAAKRLVALGVNVKVEDCDLIIENVELVYARIEELMTEMGGETTLHLLLSELPYVNEIGRYLVPHHGNSPMPNELPPEKPYGYLFNLCLRFLKEKGTKVRLEANWYELCQITSDLFIAAYNAQKYNIWDDVIFKPNEVVEKVHEMMARFNLYTLPQTNTSFTLAWCRYLCKWMSRDARCDTLLQEKLKNAERIMNWFANNANNKTCVHFKKGSKDCQLLEANKTGIENQLIVRIEKLNSGFVSPEDLNKVNGVRYPIVESDTDYILLPKPLVMWNWYEAMFNIIKPYKVLAKDIGYVMEDFVSNKMSSHGILTHTGTYNYNNIEGEVDLLIETTKADAYIESKKKSLSLKAKAGDDYYTWGDLYELIESQMQCARLEYGVKYFGPITLVNCKNGTSYSYKWNQMPSGGKRFVVKTTMTLKEYGPMQDKIILSNIIKSLVGKNISAGFDSADKVHDAEDQKRIQESFDKINEALEDLSNYYKSIGDDNPTFFCRMYSMEQIFFLIRKAKNQEHFVKLLNGGFVSTGTENFWNEYLNTIQFVN
ncbi:MAG: hypothetical protein K5920_05560 [Bacteroidales bacterium]|nr:hypothetical protein [Bacteroidales bacterium]